MKATHAHTCPKLISFLWARRDVTGKAEAITTNYDSPFLLCSSVTPGESWCVKFGFSGREAVGSLPHKDARTHFALFFFRLFNNVPCNLFREGSACLLLQNKLKTKKTHTQGSHPDMIEFGSLCFSLLINMPFLSLSCCFLKPGVWMHRSHILQLAWRELKGICGQKVEA